MSEAKLKKPLDYFKPTTDVKLGAKRLAYLVCDNCGGYPLQPVHGHFVCPDCKLPTTCCEGAPAD